MSADLAGRVNELARIMAFGDSFSRDPRFTHDFAIQFWEPRLVPSSSEKNGLGRFTRPAIHDASFCFKASPNIDSISKTRRMPHYGCQVVKCPKRNSHGFHQQGSRPIPSSGRHKATMMAFRGSLKAPIGRNLQIQEQTSWVPFRCPCFKSCPCLICKVRQGINHSTD